jgi:tetratricopeptide (TPR) repeat protein
MKILVTILFIFSIAIGQQREIDSLKKVLPTLQGKERYKALFYLSDRLEGIYPQEALTYALEAIHLSEKEGIKDSLALLFATTAYCQCLLGDFTDAIKNGFRSLDVSMETGNKKEIATAHSTLGIIHVYVGQYSTALTHHQEALRIREELGLIDPALRTLNNIGIVYHNIGMYDKAIEYYREVMRRRGTTSDTMATVRFYHNVGFAELRRGNLDTAIAYHHRALTLATKVNFIGGIAYSYYNLGLISIERQEYATALVHLKGSLRRYDSLGQKHGSLQALVAIGKAQYFLNDHATSIRTLHRAIALAKSIYSPDQLVSAYEMMHNNYAVTGPVERAFHYFRMYSHAKDSLFNSIENNKIAELTMSLHSAKSEQEVQRLRAEKVIDEAMIEQQQLRSLLLVGGIVVLLMIVLFLFYYIRNIKQSRKLLEASNSALENLNTELQDRLTDIKTLTGLLPICAHCKKIRNDKGYWEQLEGYISQHTTAKFSHGICPDCKESFFPNLTTKKEE